MVHLIPHIENIKHFDRILDTCHVNIHNKSSLVCANKSMCSSFLDPSPSTKSMFLSRYFGFQNLTTYSIPGQTKFQKSGRMNLGELGDLFKSETEHSVHYFDYHWTMSEKFSTIKGLNEWILQNSIKWNVEIYFFA